MFEYHLKFFHSIFVFIIATLLSRLDHRYQSCFVAEDTKRVCHMEGCDRDN